MGKCIDAVFDIALRKSCSVGVCDITDRKRAAAQEQELLTSIHLRARQQAAVAYLGQQALAETDLSALMDKAAVLIAQTLDVDYCQLLELLPSGRCFSAASGGWRQPAVVAALRVSASARSQAGYTLLMGEPTIVEDLRVETRFSGLPLLTTTGLSAALLSSFPAIGDWGATGDKQNQRTAPPRHLGHFEVHYQPQASFQSR